MPLYIIKLAAMPQTTLTAANKKKCTHFKKYTQLSYITIIYG